MHLHPSDPDIATLLTRIRNGDLELQPDFQRGEVWSYAKKQKLIDSILRGWHVPPIHVVEPKESARQEVLDGQQRLVSIRDFANGKVKVDGHAEPLDEEIGALDKMTYSDLPDRFRRRFDQFTIRVIRITEFKPSEPAELFFRLNQPVGLTSAEQRNAFFGKTRHQVRHLVDLMVNKGLNRDVIGFSNSRMAYDDILARVAMTLDFGTLTQKIDAARLASKYRADEPFSPDSLRRIENAIGMLAVLPNIYNTPGRFNKATLYSWLLFLVRAADDLGDNFNQHHFVKFLEQFELALFGLHNTAAELSTSTRAANELPAIYEDRATSRVADVSSVVLRDLILWIMYLLIHLPEKVAPLPNSNVARLLAVVSSTPYPSERSQHVAYDWLTTVAQRADWGNI